PSAPIWAKPGSGSLVAQIRWPRSRTAASVGPASATGCCAATGNPARADIKISMKAAHQRRTAGGAPDSACFTGHSCSPPALSQPGEPGQDATGSVQDLAEEQLRALVPRVGEECLGAVLLDDLPLVHEDHPVRHLPGKAHFVGDADHGHAALGERDHDL